MSFSQSISLEDVVAAYRVILGREIDPGAHDAWTKRLDSESVEIRTLRSELMSTEEFSGQGKVRWTSVDIGGVSLVVDANEPEFGVYIARHGHWEPHIVDIVTAALSPGSVFVDIGANVGVMSFHAARAVGPVGKVVGFEPKQENVQAYLRGMRHNGFRNIVLYPFGVSDASALFSLKGHSNAVLVGADAGDAIVQCLRADDVLRAERRIDFIKIDIEGHEPLAIAGLQETIAKHHPTMLCEFNPRCLGERVEGFATQLFAIAAGSEIQIIHHDGTEEHRYAAKSADELLRTWSALNETATQSGRLADGLLHFDLLFSS